jgi:hypothetical protein
MKRITLTIVAILLAVPAGALAKTGISFKTDPATTEPGQKTSMQVIVFREPPNSGGRAVPMAPGRHPLVVFRSESGRVVRVRAGAFNRDGMADATVTFPDPGPWHSTIFIGRKTIDTGEDAQGFGVGTAVVKTLPAAPTQSAHAASGSFPWVWVLSIAAIAAALLVLAARAGLMPARLRTLFGGGA